MPRSVDPEVKEPAERASQHEPLYLTEYCVPQNFDFPDDFRVDTRPGMLFYQVIDKNARERRVIAWWKSREAFEAWGKQFGRLLGAHEVLVSKDSNSPIAQDSTPLDG